MMRYGRRDSLNASNATADITDRWTGNGAHLACIIYDDCIATRAQIFKYLQSRRVAKRLKH